LPVALEQEGDALGVGLEGALGGLGGIDGGVEFVVRLEQGGRHGQGS
jgi:hypothetical protein